VYVGNYIKMDIKEMGWGSVDWIDLDQERDRWHVLVNVVGCVMLG
jgi:hypothetical protein